MLWPDQKPTLHTPCHCSEHGYWQTTYSRKPRALPPPRDSPHFLPYTVTIITTAEETKPLSKTALMIITHKQKLKWTKALKAFWNWTPESKLKLWTTSAAFNLSKAEHAHISSWNSKFKIKDWASLLCFQGVSLLSSSDQNKIQTTKNQSAPFPTHS